MGRGVSTRRAAAFLFGFIGLLAALVWPLDAMGDSLFAAHMAQHIVLMGIAAPLLVLGLPGPIIIRALSRGWQRWIASIAASKAWRVGWTCLTATWVVASVQLAVFLFWHAPPAIALSLQSDIVHSAMHGSLLGAALLFWTAITRIHGNGLIVGTLALLLTFKSSLIIGALLVFSPRAFYASYATYGAAWGFSPLEDQQLAGLLMMSVGAMMYLVAAVILVAAWFGAMDKTRSSQAPGDPVALKKTPAE